MVLPLIPLVLIGTGVTTGGTGLFNGVSGAGKLRTARDRAAAGKARYDLALDWTRRAVDDTNTRVKRYGTEQEDAHRRVVSRMAQFIRRNQRQVEESAARLLDGVEVEISDVPGYAGTMGAGIDWVGGVARAGATGAAAYAGIPSAVSALGTASTGTAIGTLSGAARASATLAWLGGGSLASGGGGIALGVTALNVVTVGPTLLIGGLTLNRQGEKGLTRAAAYVSEVNTAVARQAAFRSQLLAVDRRIVELSRLLSRLVVRAERSLDDLESEPFDANVHAERFQTAMRYVIAVRDLVRTPVVTADGELNRAAPVPSPGDVVSRASKPLEGEVLRRVAGKPINAATAFAALNNLIDAVSDHGRIREEERTKRRAIAAYEKIELERIRAAERILSDYFVHAFHERSSTFDALFARLDGAAEADDSRTVSETLRAIVAIAQKSPLADLGDLGKVRAALDDPDHVWQL